VTPAPDDSGNPTVNFRGEKRSNQTHESKTDPDSLLARKSGGKESKLSYSGNLSVENCNGLIVDAEVFQANGTAERDAALIMLEKLPGTQPLTVGIPNPKASRAMMLRARVTPCGLLGRYPVTASGFHLIGKETERGCEQSEDISTLLPSLMQYQNGSVPGEQLRQRLLGTPLDVLELETRLSRHTILRARFGERVHPRSLQRLRIAARTLRASER
jgi:hypothetical protein